jgi:hypothetical protein
VGFANLKGREGATGGNTPVRFRFCLKRRELQKFSRPVKIIVSNLANREVSKPLMIVILNLATREWKIASEHDIPLC